LNGKHGQHARHQVQDDAPRERQQQGGQQSDTAMEARCDRIDRHGNRQCSGRSPSLRGPIAEDEKAIQRDRRGIRDVPLEPQHQAIGIPDNGLWRAVVDHVRVGGKEAHVLEIARISGRYPKGNLLIGAGGRGEEWIRPRNPGTGGRESLCGIRVGLGNRPDRNGKPQLGLLGNADIRAGKPADMSGNRYIRALLQVGRHIDRYREQDFLLVAIADDRADRESLRRRPRDRPGREPSRQQPFDCRRQAGIPGVRPIGVPPRLYLLPQRDLQRTAGDDVSRFAAQARRDVSSVHRARLLNGDCDIGPRRCGRP
jgi:hypothetical protein